MNEPYSEESLIILAINHKTQVCLTSYNWKHDIKRYLLWVKMTHISYEIFGTDSCVVSQKTHSIVIILLFSEEALIFFLIFSVSWKFAKKMCSCETAKLAFAYHKSDSTPSRIEDVFVWWRGKICSDLFAALAGLMWFFVRTKFSIYS